jgi:hypothetical protein
VELHTDYQIDEHPTRWHSECNDGVERGQIRYQNKIKQLPFAETDAVLGRLLQSP